MYGSHVAVYVINSSNITHFKLTPVSHLCNYEKAGIYHVKGLQACFNTMATCYSVIGTMLLGQYYWDNVDGRWYPVQSPTKTGFSQQSITWGQKIEIGFGLVKSSKFRIELYAHPRSPIPTKIGLAAWAIFGPRTIVCTGATQGARARAHTHT